MNSKCRYVAAVDVDKLRTRYFLIIFMWKFHMNSKVDDNKLIAPWWYVKYICYQFVIMLPTRYYVWNMRVHRVLLFCCQHEMLFSMFVILNVCSWNFINWWCLLALMFLTQFTHKIRSKFLANWWQLHNNSCKHAIHYNLSNIL